MSRVAVRCARYLVCECVFRSRSKSLCTIFLVFMCKCMWLYEQLSRVRVRVLGLSRDVLVLFSYF